MTNLKQVRSKCATRVPTDMLTVFENTLGIYCIFKLLSVRLIDSTENTCRMQPLKGRMMPLWVEVATDCSSGSWMTKVRLRCVEIDSGR